MKRFNHSRSILALVVLVLSGPVLLAQNLEEGTDEIEHTGTEVQLDSALFGRDIFSALPEQVVVRQSPAVRSALNRQVTANAGKTMNGFRIRLFFASNRTARDESSSVIRRFNEM